MQSQRATDPSNPLLLLKYLEFCIGTDEISTEIKNIEKREETSTSKLRGSKKNPPVFPDLLHAAVSLCRLELERDGMNPLIGAYKGYRLEQEKMKRKKSRFFGSLSDIWTSN